MSCLAKSLWFAVFGSVLLLPDVAVAQHYIQTNLVSDVPGMAPVIDPNLQNPWGLARRSGGEWWISDNNNGLSTLYDGTGTIDSLVVTVPPSNGSKALGAPSGIVFNGSQDFVITPGASPANPAQFIFSSEDGTISAWNRTSDLTLAVVKVDNSKAGAVYKGLAFTKANGARFIYAANFRSGEIEIYDTNFNRTGFGSGAFRDPLIPYGFAPFNIQDIGPNLYVTYALQDAAKHDPVGGQGLGFVDVFSRTGRLLSRLQHGPWMDAPWGIVWTPRDFGELGNTLWVGNFRSGQIAAFDGATGRFIGFVLDANNSPIAIPGLWALTCGGGDSNSGPANSLFFTAGINDEKDGLFGALTPVTDELNDGDSQ